MAETSALVSGYEILGELGRGGMGIVYKARQAGLNRTVALKMILSGGHASAADLARFRIEAESVARIQHPNIVQIYEVGERDGLPFFSLEYCDGGSLAAKLDGTPWEARRAAEMVRTLARAIQTAHDQFIVYRDLKPANVLLAVSGTPKITDFGLAKQLDTSAGQTASGVMMGTPSYMAPEQVNGAKNVGPLADVYALGAVLYELLTGRPPFKAPTAFDTVMQVVSDEPARPRALNSKIPPDVEAVCLKCLEKVPSRRYESASALAEDLAAWLDGRPVVARPLGPAGRILAWVKRHPFVAGAMLVYVGGCVVFTAAQLGLLGLFGLTPPIGWMLCAAFFLPLPILLVGSISFDRKSKELRTATTRIESALDDVPAAMLTLYVSKKKLFRWIMAGGVMGFILGNAFLTKERFSLPSSILLGIFCWFAGSGVAASILGGLTDKKR
jgi:hypothetical protein